MSHPRSPLQVVLQGIPTRPSTHPYVPTKAFLQDILPKRSPKMFHCLMTFWRLPDDCLTTAWLFLTFALLLPDECRMTAWRPPDDCLMTAWKQPDNCLTTLTTTWRLIDNCPKTVRWFVCVIPITILKLTLCASNANANFSLRCLSTYILRA